MGLFDDEKYQTAAQKAVDFIKRQLNVNNFKYTISFGKEYSSSYTGDVLWGLVTGLSSSESQVANQYISADAYYTYDYTRAVSGSANASGGVKVYIYRDL